MMKIAILVLCLVAVWADNQIEIISQDSSVDVDGKYHYSYESSDGTKAEQTGQLKDVEDGPGEAIQGSFEFAGDDGNVHHMTYTADENGFVPQGNDVPQIPQAILRALEWNAAHPNEE